MIATRRVNPFLKFKILNLKFIMIIVYYRAFQKPGKI